MKKAPYPSRCAKYFKGGTGMNYYRDDDMFFAAFCAEDSEEDGAQEIEDAREEAALFCADPLTTGELKAAMEGLAHG